MRTVRVLAVAGIAILSSCAGKNATTPKASAVEPLASWNGGRIDKSRWDSFQKNNGVSATADGDELERAFNDFVRVNLQAQAAKDGGVADSTKLRRWNSIVQRIVSDFFRREYLVGQSGFSDSAILKWASTQDSSVRHQPLDTLRRLGGEALILKGVSLDSVYKANPGAFRKNIPSTLPYESVKPQVRELALAKAANAADSAKAATPQRLDSVYKANLSLFRKDSFVVSPFDSVKATVRDIALRSRQEAFLREFLPNQREAYHVAVQIPTRPSFPEDSLKLFWKQNPDRWSTPAMYRLSALGSRDSAKLAKAVAGAKDLASFRKLSPRFPVGQPIAAPGGELGRVKHQFSLPYGIGMVPQLFAQLDTAKVGGKTAIVRVNDSLFLATWLESKDSGTLKPYADVRSDIQASWEQDHPYVAPDSAVMATWDKGVLFRKSDVSFISEEVPAHMRRQFPPERVLDFMISWVVLDRAARERGFTERPSITNALLENSAAYLAQSFREAPEFQLYLFPRHAADSALAAFAKLAGHGFHPDTVGANRDGARLLLLRADEMKTAYLDGIDNYRRDSVFRPFDSVKAEVFSRLRPTLDERGQARVDSTLKARYQLKLSKEAPAHAPKLPVRAALDSARAKHDRRSIAEAETLYKQVEADASAPDSLRSQALFQLGQMHGESQNYPKSLEAYRSVLRRFPASSEAYKARFMIAFTYSEYLKVEKVAVEEYRKVLSDYPKCDLANDADWMIRNILSGGALMPKFDDSAFVADSIARADSIQKAAKPAAAKTEPAKTVATPAAKAGKASGTESVKQQKPVSTKPDSSKAKAAGSK